MGPLGSNGAMGPMAHMGPWATEVGDHSPRAQVAVRNCSQKSLFYGIVGTLPRIEEFLHIRKHKHH